MTVTVDTDVVSFFLKEPNRDSRADAYGRLLVGTTPVISLMTLAELLVWAKTKGWGERRVQRMREYPDAFVLDPFDAVVCEAWSDIKADAKSAGHPTVDADAWIAAKALSRGVPLVTHNAAHYRRVNGLEVWSVEDSAGGVDPTASPQGRGR